MQVGTWLVKEFPAALYDSTMRVYKIFLYSWTNGQRPASPHPLNRKAEAQTQETGPYSWLLLHRRKVRRMQWDCRSLQSCPDHRLLQQLQKHSVQTHWRQVRTDRGICLQNQEQLITWFSLFHLATPHFFISCYLMHILIERPVVAPCGSSNKDYK